MIPLDVQTQRLIEQAKAAYGDLICGIAVYPDGGINVALVGGEVVGYMIDGGTYSTWTAPIAVRTLGRLGDCWRRLKLAVTGRHRPPARPGRISV